MAICPTGGKEPITEKKADVPIRKRMSMGGINEGVTTERVARHGPSQPELDSLLLNFMRSRDVEESDRLLAAIIAEHAAPVIEEVVRRKLRLTSLPAGGARADEGQAEDLRSDAVVQLLTQLRRVKARPHGEETIRDLRGYAAVVATHICHRYLRRKHPQRHVLKNKLRYLLTRQSGFAVWEDEGGQLVAGFAEWRGDNASSHAEKLARMAGTPTTFVQPHLLRRDGQDARSAELLGVIFNHLGSPVVLDDLVSLVAKLWGVADSEEAGEEAIARLPDARAGADAELEQRDYLRRLWSEVVALPVRQRAALLLNLKDDQGRGCIALLPLTGVAGMRQIADALGLPAVQLAEMWNELPLDDARVAERMGLTRQQVINLRKSARARLARRLREFG